MSNSFVAPDFKLIAKIALSVAGASFVGLLIVLLVISDGYSDGYGQIINSVGLLKEALIPSMLVFGLSIVAFAGITTWLFALYASFRIAGPLFRIASDIELQIERGAVKPSPIRATDKLQREWRGFDDSATALRRHKEDLTMAVNKVEQAIGDTTSSEHDDLLKVAVSQLCELSHRVKF